MTYSPIYTSITAVQSKTGLSNTEVDLTDDNIVQATIQDAEVELELLAGRKFTDANAVTEYISIGNQDILGNYQTAIQLNKWPIESITSFQLLDATDTVMSTFGTLTSVQIAAGTIATTDYWLIQSNDPATNSMSPNGKIKFKTQNLPSGTNNVAITYTYGYATVPVMIRDLATCLAGIRLWLRFLGASYNRLNDYSIPQQSVNKGDFYARGMQNIQNLTDEANRILDRVGRKARTLFFATGADR